MSGGNKRGQRQNERGMKKRNHERRKIMTGTEKEKVKQELERNVDKKERGHYEENIN